MKTDFFISHSHSDEKLANMIAGWLNDKFKLNYFIDSNVWGYSDNLIKELNARYRNKRNSMDGCVYDNLIFD